MSAPAPWLRPGYGDVETVARRGDYVEVSFADGDTVTIDPSVLGAGGDFTVGVAEGGAAILVTTSDRENEIDWMVVRSAADPEFAQELRNRDSEEARRIGRRLKALRENRGISQKAIADVVGMPSPQLAKLEKGETDMRISTLRSLLRALGASFADIAGEDAPEISARELAKRAQTIGLPVDVIKRIAASVDPRQLIPVLANAFGWDPRDISRGQLSAPELAFPVTLKRRSTNSKDPNALLALAEALARRSALAWDGLAGTVPDTPETLRTLVAGQKAGITLEMLLGWCWAAGVIVVPMEATGGFSAGAWMISGQPVVIVKESPDYKAHWMFALAHELGHLALGHVTEGGLADIDPAWKGQDDQQEQQANHFALDLLVPGWREMLQQIARLSAPNPDGTFKFKAIDAANERGYNAPLVLLVAAFGLPGVGRQGSRWGSANNEAKLEGSARELVAREYADHIDLDRLDRLDSLLIRAVALG